MPWSAQACLRFDGGQLAAARRQQGSKPPGKERDSKPTQSKGAVKTLGSVRYVGLVSGRRGTYDRGFGMVVNGGQERPWRL